MSVKEATKRLSITTSIALMVGCGGFSVSSLTSSSSGSGEEESSEQKSGGQSGGDSDTSLDSRVFAGLTEKDNKRSARIFKTEMRRGVIARLLEDGEAFAMLEKVCGTKVWDQCEVAFRADGELGWDQWAFRKKGSDRVHWYPNILFDKAEPHWAAMAVKYIIASGDDGTLVRMTEAKCGKPLDSGCTVRARGGSGYQLTVKETGDVIDVMQTLEEWKADL